MTRKTALLAALLAPALWLSPSSQAWAGAKSSLSGLSDGIDGAMDGDAASLESKTGWGGAYDGAGRRGGGSTSAAPVVMGGSRLSEESAASLNRSEGWDGAVRRPAAGWTSDEIDPGRLHRALALARSQPDPHWQRGLVIQELPAPRELRDAPRDADPEPSESARRAAATAEKALLAVGAGTLVVMTLAPLSALGGAMVGSVTGLAGSDETDA